MGWGGWVLCTACVAEEFSVSEERDLIGARRTLWAMLSQNHKACLIHPTEARGKMSSCRCVLKERNTSVRTFYCTVSTYTV